MKIYNYLIVLFVLGFSCSISAEEITLATDTGKIFGTLETPQSKEKFPLILMIAGSGPTDRDGNGPTLKSNCYKLLAKELKTHGIATFRFDKRGVAKSKEAYINESELNFNMYVNDVCSWYNKFKTDNRFSSIHIIGHSEGALIGTIAAEKVNAQSFISIAGAGRRASDVLREQLKTKLPQNLFENVNSILSSLEQGKEVDNTPPELNMLFRKSVQPYLISWFKYDPAKELSKLQIPVLIIQGNTDIQVSVNDAELLVKSNSRAKLKIINEMNHVLKKSSPDLQEQQKTYTDPDLPIVPELSKIIADFILEK